MDRAAQSFVLGTVTSALFLILAWWLFSPLPSSFQLIQRPTTLQFGAIYPGIPFTVGDRLCVNKTCEIYYHLTEDGECNMVRNDDKIVPELSLFYRDQGPWTRPMTWTCELHLQKDGNIYIGSVAKHNFRHKWTNTQNNGYHQARGTEDGIQLLADNRFINNKMYHIRDRNFV